MYFVYVLKSLTHKTHYIGSTNDLAKRIAEHNAGKCVYTNSRKPWEIIYKEDYFTCSEAMKREIFLKSGQGRKWLDQNLDWVLRPRRTRPLARIPCSGTLR